MLCLLLLWKTNVRGNRSLPLQVRGGNPASCFLCIRCHFIPVTLKKHRKHDAGFNFGPVSLGGHNYYQFSAPDRCSAAAPHRQVRNTLAREGMKLDMQNVLDFYESYEEHNRLCKPSGQLEFERTIEIVERYIPATPSTILDIGGGTGPYSCCLAKNGHHVHLVDPVDKHVVLAQKASESQPEHPILTCTIGDARELEFTNDLADAVLLLGPLYHLTARQDRICALQEAFRVLKPGGTVFAVGISRFASLLSGMISETFTDPDFFAIVEQDLRDGQHRNAPGKSYFTDSFFHTPSDLEREVLEASFRIEALLAIEGPAWILSNLASHLSDNLKKQKLMQAIGLIEDDAALMPSSLHFMAVGRKGEQFANNGFAVDRAGACLR